MKNKNVLEHGCQLKSMYENINEFAEELTIVDKLYLKLLRLRSAFARRKGGKS